MQKLHLIMQILKGYLKLNAGKGYMYKRVCVIVMDNFKLSVGKLIGNYI